MWDKHLSRLPGSSTQPPCSSPADESTKTWQNCTIKASRFPREAADGLCGPGPSVFSLNISSFLQKLVIKRTTENTSALWLTWRRGGRSFAPFWLAPRRLWPAVEFLDRRHSVPLWLKEICSVMDRRWGKTTLRKSTLRLCGQQPGLPTQAHPAKAINDGAGCEGKEKMKRITWIGAALSNFCHTVSPEVI